MVLVGIFDHGHLELARQADNGGHRQGHGGQPAIVKALVGLQAHAHLAGAAEDGLQPAPGIDDENAHGEQSRQLDHGLEGNGGDNAVMLFLGIDMAGAEQDGEHGHGRCDAEGQTDIVNAGKTALPEFGGAGHGLDRGGHGLELQRDIGGNADHGDAGNQDGEPVGLAKAR